MGGAKPAVTLDVTYVKECIKNSGMSESEISKKMGRSRGFCHMSITTGRMGLSPFPLFCSTIGADPERAVRKEEPKKEASPAEVPVADYSKELADIRNELAELRKIGETLVQMRINQDEEQKRFFVTVNRFFSEYKNNKKYGHW